MTASGFLVATRVSPGDRVGVLSRTSTDKIDDQRLARFADAVEPQRTRSLS